MGPKPSDTQAVQLRLALLGGEDIDEADLEAMTRSLRSQIEELPFVQAVSPPSGPEQATPPKGTKAVELQVLATLAMTVVPNAIPAAIAFLKEWVLRPGTRPVEVQVQRSERSITVKFDPRTVSDEYVKTLAADIQAMLEE